jgi:hypothetical protein
MITVGTMCQFSIATNDPHITKTKSAEAQERLTEMETSD